MVEEQRRPKNIAFTTLGDRGTYATIFYWDEVPLGITAEKFKELVEADGTRKVMILELNQAAKCVFDREFKQFVGEHHDKFSKIGALVVGKTLAERSRARTGNPASLISLEHFEKDIFTDATLLAAEMERQGISFGDLE